MITQENHLDSEGRLREAGLRSTAPRRAVLEALSRGGHYDAAEVFEAVGDELPGTSLQAIYGVLGALTDARLLRRIDSTAGSARYETRIGDNHHHLICRQCGTVQDIDCVVGEAPCLTPTSTHGFVVEQAEVVFRGLCAECTNAPHASAAHTERAQPVQ